MAVNAEGSRRLNLSSSATFYSYELENPFAEGNFRWVARGRYTSGPRKGQACVAKWFKTGNVFSETFFEKDLQAVDKAAEIVDAFNKENVVNKKIVINYPGVWTWSTGKWKGAKNLAEPFIQNYQKFNSNSGWNDDSKAWPQVMQALSHFSYHVSSGQFVLCDLQGGIYQSSVVLTDPVVLSRSRRYGVTDLGAQGISNFFSQHTCNDYCRYYWQMPREQRQYFRPVPGTTMMKNVPTQASRPLRTAYYD